MDKRASGRSDGAADPRRLPCGAGTAYTCQGEAVQIVRFLGRGKGGYSYLGLYRGVQVVVKQIHYEPCPVYRFPPNKLQRELSDYAALRAVGLALPRLIGYNDSEQFLVKEFIGGQPIDELIARGELTPQHFEGIFHICDQVYGRGFNLDFFPSNFILRDGEMYYVDFECNEYSPQWDFEHWGVYFWVNRDGMAQYLRTGDHKYLSRNGKPLKWGLRKRASRVLVLGKRKQGRR